MRKMASSFGDCMELGQCVSHQCNLAFNFNLRVDSLCMKIFSDHSRLAMMLLNQLRVLQISQQPPSYMVFPDQFRCGSVFGNKQEMMLGELLDNYADAVATDDLLKRPALNISRVTRVIPFQ